MTKLFLFSLLAAATFAAEQNQWMDISVERLLGPNWRAIDPALVLNKDDLIRFRFRSNFDGYLYVINRGSSGKELLLFPLAETGTSNKIQAGRDYMIPSMATSANFRISGPAGYDSVYWLVSPVPLSNPPTLPQSPHTPREDAPPDNVKPSQTARLTPRCDPSQMQARGLCLDSDAGPRNVDDLSQAPNSITRTPQLKARDITIIQRKDRTRLSAGTSLGGPLVYEFRLAHK